MPDGLSKLLREVGPFDGFIGCFAMIPVHTVVPGHFPQHHFGMLRKIAVDGDAVLRFAQVYPIGFNVDGAIPLLQENDVAGDFRTGVGFEGVVRQTDGPQQFRPLGQIFAHFRGFGVHGVFGRDKRHDAARTHLIQRFGEEIVVNVETELIIGPVDHFIIPKGHVAHRHVEEIPAIRGFKARHRNIGLGIKLLGDPAGDTVQFHAVELAFPHILRQHPEEIAHAHGGLQDIARFEAHVAQGFIDGADHGRRSVMRVQGGSAGGAVFIRRQGVL